MKTKADISKEIAEMMKTALTQQAEIKQLSTRTEKLRNEVSELQAWANKNRHTWTF